MTTTMIRRYGLIGAGAMGQVYLQALSEVDGAELAAVAEPNSEPLTWTFQTLRQSRHSPTIYSDWTEMLANAALDAVIVTTPNDLHTEMVGEVLRASHHLLIESPVCITSKDRNQLARVLTRSENIVHTGLAFRHDALVGRLFERVQAGDIGDPFMVTIRQHFRPPRRSIEDWALSNARAGGLLLDAGCHAFDLICQLFGRDPIRVYASAGMNQRQEANMPNGLRLDRNDNAFVILDFDGGLRGHLDLCEFGFDGEPVMQVCVTGSRGQLSAELPTDAMLANVVARLRQFHRVLVTGDSGGASLQDGLKAVDIALAATQSAATGKVVTI